MDHDVARYLGTYLKLCLEFDECRGPQGVQYPAGLLIFGILLAMCARNEGQRSQARWFKRNWGWIKKAWLDGGGKKPSTDRTPHQSTISRFESAVPSGEFAKIVDTAERRTMQKEMKDLADIEMDVSQDVQICVDGKARCGCTSESTGRTEIDVTMFNPDTGQILASRSLEDKQGEIIGLKDMLDDVGTKLEGATVTCDAGMTSIMKSDKLERAAMEGVVQIKGNSGESFEEIKNLEWESVSDKSEEWSHDHGRDELRITRRIDLNFCEVDFSEKYPSVGCVVQIEAWARKITTGRISQSKRYYLGTDGVAGRAVAEVGTTIRKHWGVESFHWSKDKTLGEDRSQIISSNASRFTGRVRSMVAHIGKATYGSVVGFVDDFAAAPHDVAFSRGKASASNTS